MHTEGVTRSNAENRHRALKTWLPESLRKNVSDDIRPKGQRTMMYEVQADPSHISEIAGICRESLINSAETKHMGRDLKAVAENRPESKARNSFLGKLKNMAEHEFGNEAVDAKWYP